MMRKKFKIAVKAAFVIGAAFALMACSRGQGTEDTVKDGRVQLMVWYSGGKTAAGVFERLIEEFNGSQEIYQVTGITQADYDETYEKLQAGIAAKSAPDVALLDADKARNLAKKNLLADLSGYVGIDDTFDKDDFLDVFYRQGMLEDGMTFALPFYGTTQVMYYNRELFSQAGIDPEEIKNWQDLARASKTIVEQGRETKVLFGWEPMWGPDNLIDAALSNGAKILSEDQTTVLIDSEEWVEVWESFRGWIHDEKTMGIHYGGQGWEYWYATMDDVLTGKAGGYTGSSGDQADLDFSVVGAMEQPGFAGNQAAPVARALQLVMVDTGKEKSKQGVYAFMKFMTEAKQQAEWSMATGYVPVRNSTQEVDVYREYVKQAPHAAVPFMQAMHGSVKEEDPTGGKIYDALEIAADQVELENIPAKQALEEACHKAQNALDESRK